MEKQNVTLSLPKDFLKKAKVLAARHHLSLSELIRQLLEEKVFLSSIEHPVSSTAAAFHFFASCPLPPFH
jgi:hypothetical protein